MVDMLRRSTVKQHGTGISNVSTKEGQVQWSLGLLGQSVSSSGQFFCANFVPNVCGTMGDFEAVGRRYGIVMNDGIAVDLVITY